MASNWVESVLTQMPDSYSFRCKAHKDEPVQRYCLDCDSFVCIDCVSEDHIGHRLRKFKDITDGKKNELKQFIYQTKNETLVDLEKRIGKTREMRANYLKETGLRVQDIRSRAAEVKTIVDEISCKLVDTVLQNQETIEQEFGIAERKLTESHESLDKMIKNYETYMQEEDFPKIIQACRDFEHEVRRRVPCISVSSTEPPKFLKGNTNGQLESLFGHLEEECENYSDFIEETEEEENVKKTLTRGGAFKVRRNHTRAIQRKGNRSKGCLSADIRMPSRIKVGNNSSSVSAMMSVSPYEAWLCDGNENTVNQLKKIHKRGSVLETKDLTFDIDDIDMDKDGNLIVSELNGHNIHRIHTQTEQREIIADLSPLIVSGVCVLGSGDIAVCVVDKKDFVPNIKSTRAIQIVSENGKLKCQFNYNGNTREPLFVQPKRLAENQNGDICVVDSISEETGRVIVISGTGKQRFSYDGSSNKSSKFNPTDIAIANDSSIFITDKYYGIHQLTAFGQFARYLMTEEQGLWDPLSIVIDKDDKAWIGCEKGVIQRVRVTFDVYNLQNSLNGASNV